MTLWKKSDEEAPAKDHVPLPAPPVASVHMPQQPPRDGAVIGPSIEVTGNLAGNEDLQIEGRVDGKIELHQNSVTVGKNGRVKGDIFGRQVVVHGVVDGNLFGEERIVLHQSSKVNGNLFAPRVTLEDGSQFKGSIDMTARQATQQQEPRTSS